MTEAGAAAVRPLKKKKKKAFISGQRLGSGVEFFHQKAAQRAYVPARSC